MNAQRRDLVSSRHALESEGGRFGCMECGAELPPVSAGHTSDICEKCQAAEEERRLVRDYEPIITIV